MKRLDVNSIYDRATLSVRIVVYLSSGTFNMVDRCCWELRLAQKVNHRDRSANMLAYGCVLVCSTVCLSECAPIEPMRVRTSETQGIF